MIFLLCLRLAQNNFKWPIRISEQPSLTNIHLKAKTAVATFRRFFQNIVSCLSSILAYPRTQLERKYYNWPTPASFSFKAAHRAGEGSGPC